MITWQNLTLAEQKSALSRPAIANRADLTSKVLDIVNMVKDKGDDALLTLTEKFDGLTLNSVALPSSQAEDIIAFPKIGNRNRVVIQYESAINARAKADLLPDIATVHQRKEGDHLADRSEETKNELLAESQRIIRNMCGLNRSTVTLI